MAGICHFDFGHIEIEVYPILRAARLRTVNLMDLRDGVHYGAGARAACKAGADVEGDLLVVCLALHGLHCLLEARHEVAAVAAGEVVGEERAAEAAALSADACGNERTEFARHQVDIARIEEALDAGIERKVLEHVHAEPVDRHLLRLFQMHILAHHFPALARIEVVFAGIYIEIVDAGAVGGFVGTKFLINFFAELAQHLAARTAKTNEKMVCHSVSIKLRLINIL